MTYRFLEEHKDPWPVRWLCEALAISPASSYAWRQCPPALRSNDATPSSWRSGSDLRATKTAQPSTRGIRMSSVIA